MNTIALKTIFLWVSLAVVTLAQSGGVDVSVAKVKAIGGISAARVVGDTILVSDDSKPVVTQVALLTVNTKAKFVRIKARKSLFEFGQVAKIGDAEWLLVGSGRFAVEIMAFDPDTGIEETAIEVELGEPQPEPGPEPGPQPGPVPPDAFDNLGQRIAGVSAGLPKRSEVAAVYRAVAKQLREDPLLTVANAVESSQRQRVAIVGSDSQWGPFTTLLNADLQRRWPMAKGTLADFFDAVANGLGGQR